jgi:RND family efflux transporter MFP subunit
MSSFTKKLVWPALGLLLVGALVAQARGMSIVDRGARTPDASAAANTSEREPLHIRGEGRVATYPGAQVTLGSELSARLLKLDAQEGTAVKKGDVIAELDTSELRPQLAAAQARVRELQADVQLLQTDLGRAQTLTTMGATSVQSRDQAQHARDSAQARLEGANAEVERLRAVIAKARVRAPFDGVVVTRSAEPGEIVSAGRALLTIAELSRVRIEAEIDEFDAARVALGAAARIRAEGYDAQHWNARVQEIPDAVSGRKLKPQDPGRPEDTRVLLVKLALDDHTPLHLGQRVEVEIDLDKR